MAQLRRRTHAPSDLGDFGRSDFGGLGGLGGAALPQIRTLCPVCRLRVPSLLPDIREGFFWRLLELVVDTSALLIRADAELKLLFRDRGSGRESLLEHLLWYASSGAASSSTSETSIDVRSIPSPGSETCSRIVAIALSCEKSRTTCRQKGSLRMSHAGCRMRSKTKTWPHASAHFECIVLTCVTPSQ